MPDSIYAFCIHCTDQPLLADSLALFLLHIDDGALNDVDGGNDHTVTRSPEVRDAAYEMLAAV